MGNKRKKEERYEENGRYICGNVIKVSGESYIGRVGSSGAKITWP